MAAAPPVHPSPSLHHGPQREAVRVAEPPTGGTSIVDEAIGGDSVPALLGCLLLALGILATALATRRRHR